MSTKIGVNDVQKRRGALFPGAISGAAGGLVMGALIMAMNPPTISVAIPSLYGLAPPPAPRLGIFIHTVHGIIFGVVFSGLIAMFGVSSTGEIVGFGIAWSVIIWVIFSALLMPIWLDAVGSPASPPFPNFAIPSLLWHAIYGLVVGGVYVYTFDRLDTSRSTSRSSNRQEPVERASTISNHELMQEFDYFVSLYLEWPSGEFNQEFVDPEDLTDFGRDKERMDHDMERLQKSFERDVFSDEVLSKFSRAIAQAGANEYVSAGGDREEFNTEKVAEVVEDILTSD
jgi:hypothetical protein